MSDPTIQTFCCHRSGNKEDMAVKIMNEFNTDSYNAVCLVSSTIGIIGAFYQILPHLLRNRSRRFLNMSSRRGQHIIIWLATADLLASSGVLIRSSLWLRYKNIMPMPDDGFSVLFCSITSAWTQYFYTATWLWTLFYAIDTWLTIKGRDSHKIVYHSVAWGLPAVTTGAGLSILYLPNATCHNLTSVTSALLKILPNYCATYLPIAVVMVVNPIIYVLAGKDVEMAVALPLAQFTNKERKFVDALRLKFFLINAVFYICWLPNLINGVLLWTMWFNMPVKVVISIWYIMICVYTASFLVAFGWPSLLHLHSLLTLYLAFVFIVKRRLPTAMKKLVEALMNPMQALFNAMVYRKWNSNVYGMAPTVSIASPRGFQFSDEQSPLLGSEPPRLHLDPLPSSINNYSTL